MRQAGWLILVFFLGSMGYSQTNDRERYQSDVFNANRSVDNQLAQAVWKSGSWFFVPEWRLNQLGYDSNVFASEANQVSDFSVEPGLGLEMFYRPNPRLIWKNEIQASYAYYVDVEQLRGFNYLGESRMYFLQKRFNLDLGVRATRDQKRLNSEIDARSFNRNIVYDLNSLFEVGGRGFIKTRTYFRDLSFDRQEDNFDPQYSELERKELSGSATYLMKMKPTFWPYLQVSYLKGMFDSANNRRDNSALKSAYLGFRNEFLRRTHYNLRAGMTAIEFPNDPEADTEEFDFRGYYSRKFTRRATFNGSYIRTPIYSVYESFNYFISQRATLGLLFDTRGKWGIGPTATVGKNDYSVVPGQTITSREDDWREFGIRIKLPPQFFKELNLNITYYDRNSNITGLSDDGFQIYTSLDSNQF